MAFDRRSRRSCERPSDSGGAAGRPWPAERAAVTNTRRTASARRRRERKYRVSMARRIAEGGSWVPGFMGPWGEPDAPSPMDLWTYGLMDLVRYHPRHA